MKNYAITTNQQGYDFCSLITILALRNRICGSSARLSSDIFTEDRAMDLHEIPPCCTAKRYAYNLALLFSRVFSES